MRHFVYDAIYHCKKVYDTMRHFIIFFKNWVYDTKVYDTKCTTLTVWVLQTAILHIFLRFFNRFVKRDIIITFCFDYIIFDSAVPRTSVKG